MGAKSASHGQRPAGHRDEFRSAYAAAGVAMARLTLAAEIIDVNAQFAALLGRPAEELVGVELLDLIHPEDASAMRAGRLSSFERGSIHAELRLLAGEEVVWGRATLRVARQPGDLPDCLVLTVEDVSESRRREAELERRRRFDPETGLPNAELLFTRLAEAIRAATPANRPVVLLLLEFDRVTAIGEEPDEAVAAELLDQLTRRLGDQLRPRDFIARTGGNEFGVILADVDGAELAEEVGKRVLAGLEPALRLGGADVRVPVSMGIATAPVQGRNAEALIRHARRDLYGGDAGIGAGAPDPQESLGDQVEHRLSVLEPVSLFNSMSEKVLRRIARHLSAQTAAAGEELARPGEAPALRIIEEGLCDVSTPEQLRLVTLGPGDFIGAESLLLEESLPVHLRAASDCKLLVLESDALDQVAPPGSDFRAALRAAATQRDGHLRALVERPRHARAGSLALNLAVYSAKGGAGRTTLALNLAAELGRRHSGEALLVDLSLPFNHVALLANLSPSTCLARAGQADPRQFGPLLWSSVLPHPAGFMVLPAALRPEEADLVTPDLVGRMLAAVGEHFRYIVFDLGANLDERVLAALEVSDQVVLIATPELAALHDTRQVLDLATRVLKIPAGRIHPVLNHRSPDSAMTGRVVEDVIGRRLEAEFRYSGTSLELAGLEGQLQVKNDPRGDFSRSVRQLLDGLVGQGASRTA